MRCYDRYTRRSIRWFSIAFALAATGCSGQFNEVHLLQSVDIKNNQPGNIFRITVKGDVSFTNARYLSGMFDERAVEAFFNETKAQTIDYSAIGTGVPGFFPMVPCADPTTDECKAQSAAATKLVPLGSKANGDGVFVMLLSTNPDAIASTINAFVDSDQVVQSTMFLATKNSREKVAALGAARSTVATARSDSFKTIGVLLDKADGKGAAAVPTQAERDAYYLSVLQEAAAGLAPDSAPVFETFTQAKTWFNALPRSEPK